MAKNNKRTILVTGATGRQGGAVLRHLQEKGFPARALTRDPDTPAARKLVGHGTEVFRGNLNDLSSISRALDGVEGVYSVQSWTGGIEEEVRQGFAVADAAARARLSHFVYSSVASSDQKTGIPHFESKYRIEEHVRGTGLRFTILRPVFFMENWLGMREQIEAGTLALPLASGTRLQMIAVDDIGAFGAMAFEKPGHWQGRTVELAGDELSMTELATAFGRMAGHEVKYQQVPWDEFEEKAGVETTTMYRWFQDVGYHVETSAVRQSYPALTSFDKWLNGKWTKVLTA